MSQPNVRVMVVDDQSPDGTGALADQLAREYPGRIEVMHRTLEQADPASLRAATLLEDPASFDRLIAEQWRDIGDLRGMDENLALALQHRGEVDLDDAVAGALLEPFDVAGNPQRCGIPRPSAEQGKEPSHQRSLAIRRPAPVPGPCRR